MRALKCQEGAVEAEHGSIEHDLFDGLLPGRDRLAPGPCIQVAWKVMDPSSGFSKKKVTCALGIREAQNGVLPAAQAEEAFTWKPAEARHGQAESLAGVESAMTLVHALE